MKQINRKNAINNWQILTAYCLVSIFLTFSFTACSEDEEETYVPVTSIEASAESLTLERGQKEALLPTISPENATMQRYSWESSDATVANVTNAGVVTGLRKGEANIILKSPREALTDTVKVTVLGPPIDVNKVEGSYAGIVTMNGTAVGANIPLAIQFTSTSTISIDTRAVIMGGLMTLHVHGNSISISSEDDGSYIISGAAITDDFGYGPKNTTIDGTVSASGKIYLHIKIVSITEKVEYNGQKK